MTTWTGIDKSRADNYLNRETYEILLRENGEYLLREDSSQDWGAETKNVSSWFGEPKTLTEFNLLIDSEHELLIDSSYSMIIDNGNYAWTYQIKN